MLQRLIEAALRRRMLVLLFAAALVVHGVRVLTHARLDVLPDFAPPQVTVQTECPGRTAEQVEAEVTRLVESAVQGAIGVAAVRSESIQGLSLVQVVFADGTEPFRARQSIGELLTEAAGRLPAGVGAPRLTPLTSATMDLLKVGFVSDTLSQRELRDFVQWTVEPHLRAVPGVANVSLFGGEVQRYELQVHGDRLAAAGLTLADVAATAAAATGVRAAGYLESATQRLPVETHGGSGTLDHLREAVVGTRLGAPLRMFEVADLVATAAPRFGDCLIQGRDGVLLTTTSQFGANTMALTRAVEAALAELAPTLHDRGITVLPHLHRPATFIEHALANLTASLLLGIGLVAVVLLLFLFDLRAACISLLAIPLSLLTAVLVLDRLGMALDTMALGGLAMALGEVVDDAIVDVENIVRRLRLNGLAAVPRRAFDVVLAASLEVRGAVVHATFVVVLVFVPVIGMQGLAGRLFAPLGIAYVVAVLASLLVALLVTPALSLLLLRPGHQAADAAATPLARAFGRLLDPLLHHPGKLLAIVAALCLWAAFAGQSLAGEFVPPFREGHFVAHLNMAPGTSLLETKRVGARVSAALLASGLVATVEQQIGRTDLGEDPWPPNQSELHIELVPMAGADEARAETAIRALLRGFPGIATDVLTFLGDRIGETITGETADVVVTLFGEELDRLDAAAAGLVTTLREIPGTADVQLAAEPGLPQLAVHLRPRDLAACGLGAEAVLEALAVATQGSVVAQLRDGIRSYDVAVTLAPGERRDASTLAGLPLLRTGGRPLLLAAVADVDLTHGRGSILHEGGRRRQVVTANLEGRSYAEVVEDLRAALTAHRPPADVQVAIGGTAAARGEATMQLLEGSLLVGLLVLALLRAVFRTLRNTLLVLVNLPFTFVGGVLALWLANGALDMGALVGFVTLFGITTRNSIMLLSHYEHLVHDEGCPWNGATARRGTLERLRPILMTAVVTACGLLPIALGRAEAGREIEGPMALVIVGGLTTSTLLNLLVMPALCLRFGRFGRPAATS